MKEAITLTQKLIQIPSITPNGEAVLHWIEESLADLNPTQHHRLVFEGENSPPVSNLLLTFGKEGPHFCFVGHVDVVPPGPLEAWTHPPFSGTLHEGRLIGRGASDMKGGIGAFMAALRAFLTQDAPLSGRISLLLTCDEEGPSVNGIAKVMPWLKHHNCVPDLCLIGEPTSSAIAGDTLKIGRRGSATFRLSIHGTGGHVAYPHLATNPIPLLAQAITALTIPSLDEDLCLAQSSPNGAGPFDPSHLEISAIACSNEATNVISETAWITLNVRFNLLHTVDSLEQWIRDTCIRTLETSSASYTLDRLGNSTPFLCEDKASIDMMSRAITEVTKIKPYLSTSGGTSDGRFIAPYCPVLELGPCNRSIHKVNESVGVVELEQLTRIYRTVLEKFFTPS